MVKENLISLKIDLPVEGAFIELNTPRDMKNVELTIKRVVPGRTSFIGAELDRKAVFELKEALENWLINT